MWGGHSCPPLLILVLNLILNLILQSQEESSKSKSTSKAADNSVRPTQKKWRRPGS